MRSWKGNAIAFAHSSKIISDCIKTVISTLNFSPKNLQPNNLQPNNLQPNNLQPSTK
ncbi:MULTISPECIES: hypothetical protein [unclassified Moorena]|uniref:hypothetical protein n=1 Tax=unclassified Moorena TaxID=2683338 RepID=UPI0013B7F220|nr:MULTISPECIES: hypothetical protein [unclassified Moorena]NEP37570.1 hypothetical protein [Moorena sp. SIO3B2]NEQ07801.1 hypothetical protein [Moorena sp. SIO4E2]NER86095.1 hypothetical protein [Moorena sp. SIO3A2]